MRLEDLDIMISTLKVKGKHIAVLLKDKRSNFPIVVLNPKSFDETINISKVENWPFLSFRLNGNRRWVEDKLVYKTPALCVRIPVVLRDRTLYKLVLRIICMWHPRKGNDNRIWSRLIQEMKHLEIPRILNEKRKRGVDGRESRIQ